MDDWIHTQELCWIIGISKKCVVSNKDMEKWNQIQEMLIDIVLQKYIMHNNYVDPALLRGQGYDSFSNVGESCVWWRADFQSGSWVLKKVFWTFSYLYLWHTKWFHEEKLLKALKYWKSLYLPYKSGSRPPKIPPKNFALNCDWLNFF